MDNKVVSDVFGTLGAVCWSIQLTPQILLNYRRHSARGLSSSFMMCWACAGVPLGVFNIVSNFNIALQIQPQILTMLSLITWIQCYYYERKWSIVKALAVVTPTACMMGGIEAALVFALRIGIEHGVHWPVTLVAVLAACCLALGVLEQYLAIWKHRSVEGISFLFCGIDAMGDLTSIISVVFQPKLDIVGMVTYGVEFVLWMGIFASGGYLGLLPWLKRKIKRHRMIGEAPEPDDGRNGAASVALHDLPSSTSVFRTPSAEHELRSRAPVSLEHTNQPTEILRTG